MSPSFVFFPSPIFIFSVFNGYSRNVAKLILSSFYVFSKQRLVTLQEQLRKHVADHGEATATSAQEDTAKARQVSLSIPLR